ncbi:MAG: DUF4143 domain-containing protein [bacterium]|nr:DUF4143 domain-containing protein [bacterium]
MQYLTRLVDPWLAEILASAPAVMITGARAAGKTTTALRHAASVVRLDNEREAAPFRADPDAALRDRPEPVLLDEWQECPEVLGALKRAVDTERRPGRFILAGSVHSDVDPALSPGTGRLIRVPMHPLTVREQLSHRGRLFLDRLLTGDGPEDPGDAPDLRGYAEMALRGGFPEPAVHLPHRIRNRWLADYVEQLTHGRPGRGRGPDRSRLSAFFSAYALNSAGVAADTTLYQAAGIDRRTAHAYTKLLGDLGAIAELPAWSSNRLKRLTRGPKRYVADTGLWGAAVGADAGVVMSDGDLLGRLIDTFVANQLRAEVAVDPNRPRLHHLRDRDGRHEVDLIADLGVRGLVAIEIKAHSAPSPRHARHLAWLRDQMGGRFLTGVLLHTGPAAFQLADRIRAVPISALWS